MTTDSEKIRDAVKQSNSFALFLDENFEEHELLAREAFRIALRAKEANVYLFPETPKIFKEKWSGIIPVNEKPDFLYHTSIRIPKNRPGIKEVEYEEKNGFLVLNIFSENNSLKQNEIIFEPKPSMIDAVFCFGLPDVKFLMSSEKFLFPPEEKIFYPASKKTTIAEKVFDITQNINTVGEEERVIATLLLASLLTETNGLNDIDHDALALAAKLMETGAQKESIDSILNKNRTINFARILGRALARTTINARLNSAWTFISAQDLEKSGNKNSDSDLFYQIICKLRSLIPPQPIFVLLWESENGVFVLAASEEKKDIIKNLSVELNSEKINGFIVAGPYDSFSEAELKTQNALKKSFNELE